MPRQPSQKTIARAVLKRHGQTYAEELDISLEKNTPSPLFEMFCAALLFSARISAEIATDAARALRKAGWRTAEKMAQSTWEQRTKVLNKSGYARYDESTSRMLGEGCEMLLERYKGDLRKLRDTANQNPQEERKLLMEFKGIGEVGADIFFREMQVAWPEWIPFADKRAMQSAAKLGLPDVGKNLAKLVDEKDVAKLVAGLVRVSFAKDEKRIIEIAGK